MSMQAFHQQLTTATTDASSHWQRLRALTRRTLTAEQPRALAVWFTWG